MADQPRVAKVLTALLFSMTTGAIVLMALGNNPPSAGPFCLSSYSRLDPVKEAIRSRACQSPARWNSIEVHFSGTRSGDIQRLAERYGLSNSEDLNCHFVIYNGAGGGDGQIQPTEKWQRQWSIIPNRTWHGSTQTIRIFVVADGETAYPTDSQVRRTEILTERLCRKFGIQGESVYYPGNWQ